MSIKQEPLRRTFTIPEGLNPELELRFLLNAVVEATECHELDIRDIASVFQQEAVRVQERVWKTDCGKNTGAAIGKFTG